MPDKETSAVDELQLLKTLLIGDEKKSIDQIQERLDSVNLRAEEIAKVLPQALQQSAKDGNRLTWSLQEPVETCLRTVVRKDTRTIADLLYPVMGPAIRRSITETLRGMLQSINKTLDESFSLRGLGWRLESMRTGAPFSDIVLRNTLIYRVEQVFLIQPETGLLMQYMAAPDVPEQDPDAVSAMLTAIQDFASDSFSRSSPNEELETVDMGDHTIWLVHGPHALLAGVIRGLPPISLRDRFSEVLEQIHTEFSEQLTRFDGDRTPLFPTEPLLGECFVSEQKKNEKSGRSWVLILILLVLAGLIVWWGYSEFQERQRRAQLIALLDSSPGIIILDHQVNADRMVIRGLRDKLSKLPIQKIENIGFTPHDIQFNWRNYQSDDPQIALQRAKTVLGDNTSVTLTLDQRVLRAKGIATPEWQSQAHLASRMIPGITGFDGASLMTPDEALLKQVTQRLDPPAGISLVLHNGVLNITGEAPNAWLLSARNRLSGLKELKKIHTNESRPSELKQIMHLADALEQIQIFFEPGKAILSGQDYQMQRIFQLIEGLQPLYQKLDEPLQIKVTGFTDGTGHRQLNQELAQQRADTVIQKLKEKGLSPELFSTETDITGHVSAPTDKTDMLRRAALTLNRPWETGEN